MTPCLDLHPGNIIVQRNLDGTIRLCFIDTGIVAQLTRQDRRNFVDLFHAIVTKNGRRVGQLMIERSVSRQCCDPEGFIRGVEEIVDEVHNSGLTLGKIGFGNLLQRLLVLCYRHQVRLESRYVSVLIAIGIVEGLGRQLAPDIDILKTAAPFVIRAAISSASETIFSGIFSKD